MADRKVTALTELTVTPATGDLFHIVDISEAADADKNKKITWGTIDTAIDTIIAANNSGFLVAASDLSDVANAATARTNLGVAIGSDVQAWDDDLDDIAALTPTKGNLLAGNGTDWIALGVGTDTQVLTADSAEASGIKWAAGGGGGGAPTDATYIVQTANATLTNEQVLGALATGIVKNTTTTGVLSIAAEGTDYYGPSGTDVAVADGGTGASTAQAAIDTLTDVASATNEHVLTKDTASGNAIFKASAGGGLSNVVEDATPQLGGSLDVNGNSIVSVSAGNISITPDTTGSIILDGLSWPQSDGTANYVLETDGAGQLGWVAQSGGGGSSTLADIATNSTTTEHQTFALDAETSFIIEDSVGTDIFTVAESTNNITVTGDIIVGDSDKFEMVGSGRTYSMYTAASALTFYEDSNGSLLEFNIPNRAINFQYLLKIQFPAAGNLEPIADQGGRTFFALRGGSHDKFNANHYGTFRVTYNADYNNPDLTVHSDGDVGIGMKDLAPGARLHVVNEDSATATTTNIIIAEHQSTGTPATNFGVGYAAELESSTTTGRDAGRLFWKWTTATDATRAAEGALTAYYTSTEETPIRWGADSSGETLGFYNTSPISQPSATGETTGFTAGSGTGVNDDSTFTGNVGSTAYRISDIVQHLKNLGLLAQ